MSKYVTGPEQRPAPHPFYGANYERGSDPWHPSAFVGTPAEGRLGDERTPIREDWFLLDGVGNLIGWVPDGTEFEARGQSEEWQWRGGPVPRFWRLCWTLHAAGFLVRPKWANECANLTWRDWRWRWRPAVGVPVLWWVGSVLRHFAWVCRKRGRQPVLPGVLLGIWQARQLRPLRSKRWT